MAAVLWDFESVNFINGMLRTEPPRVREYLCRLDAWLKTEGAGDANKKVFCFGTAHKHFAELLIQSGWEVIVCDSPADNPLRDLVSLHLFEKVTAVFVFISDDPQYLTEIRNVERHGARAVVIRSAGEGCHTLQSVTRRSAEAPQEGRVYTARVRKLLTSGAELVIFPSMRRGRTSTPCTLEEGERVTVCVRRAYSVRDSTYEHYDLEVQPAPVPHAKYTATVYGTPLEDRVRISILVASGWSGVVYERAPFAGFPPKRGAKDYADGDEVVVELLAARGERRIFRIVE